MAVYTVHRDFNNPVADLNNMITIHHALQLETLFKGTAVDFVGWMNYVHLVRSPLATERVYSGWSSGAVCKEKMFLFLMTRSAKHSILSSTSALDLIIFTNPNKPELSRMCLSYLKYFTKVCSQN